MPNKASARKASLNNISFTLHGLGISGGIAIGRATLMSHATLEVAHLTVSPRMVEKEVERLEKAILAVRDELKLVRGQADNAPPELTAFIDVHIGFLSDPELVDVPTKIIRERRCNAEWALVQQMENLVQQFEQFEDLYLRERKYDIVQVVERVIKELMGHPSRAGLRTGRGVTEEPQIVVAHDLSPADTINFKEQHFASFVTDVGGATSHTAILARSMAIPAIVGLSNARALICDQEMLIVDGERGVVIVNPDARILEEYRLRKEELEIERNKLKRLRTAKSQTLDGTEIALLANIELPSDLTAVLESGANGIGLFRTEYLFLGRGDMPSEDEQFEAYRKVAKGMEGRPAIIRTFDLGADKAIDAKRIKTNPALGRRAIRLSLSEPKMFQKQLRALLRASKYGNLKILFPMLAHAHEIEQTLAAIDQAKASLRVDRVAFNEAVEIGAMIEIPAAALAVNMFLRRLDFLSIGTNDLIQYSLAIDRMDEDVASLYDPLHPAILMLLAHVIVSAEKVHTPVSVCGEIAGDPAMTRLLLGMGLHRFSMHSSQILEIKSRVMKSDITELAPQVRRMLRLDDPVKLKEALEKLNAT